MPITPWYPLLDGELRRRALDAVSGIAGALHGICRDRQIDASLMKGQAGIALFFAYLERAGLDEGAGAQARAQLELAMEAVASQEMSASLYHGLAGVAWLVAHLGRSDNSMATAMVLDFEDPTEELDEILLAHVAIAAPGEFDLLGGMVGIGVYALERLPCPRARALLERVVARLDEVADRRAGSVAWWTPPQAVPVSDRAVFPDGYHNLGLAHGVPGVIALLARASAAGVASERANALLQRAVPWLLSQRLPPNRGSRMPALLAPGLPGDPARLAWCYGEPGVSAALLLAAQAAGRSDWRGEALAMAQATARASTSAAGVADACLCHGAAGLGHLLNRMSQRTGDAALRDGARRWYGEALDLRMEGRGVAGFAAWVGLGEGRVGALDDPGFLLGAAGIGLSLLAATGDIEPAWDRVLLLSA